MKKFLILTLFLFSLTVGQITAQAGLNISYTTLDAPNWEELRNESVIFQFENNGEYSPTLKYGVDYWFRLPKVRIEFFPTLSYSKFSDEPVSLQPDLSAIQSLELSLFDFSLHTNIYFLDFLGDCDCPTFSKQDPIFKKGLFIQVSPGITGSLSDINYIETVSSERAPTFDSSPSFGLGLGLDIGFSDLFTLTPFVRAKRTFNATWKDLEPDITGNQILNSSGETNHLTQFEAGIRLGIRWKT